MKVSMTGRERNDRYVYSGERGQKHRHKLSAFSTLKDIGIVKQTREVDQLEKGEIRSDSRGDEFELQCSKSIMQLHSVRCSETEDELKDREVVKWEEAEVEGTKCPRKTGLSIEDAENADGKDTKGEEDEQEEERMLALKVATTERKRKREYRRRRKISEKDKILATAKPSIRWRRSEFPDDPADRDQDGQHENADDLVDDDQQENNGSLVDELLRQAYGLQKYEEHDTDVDADKDIIRQTTKVFSPNSTKNSSSSYVHATTSMEKKLVKYEFSVAIGDLFLLRQSIVGLVIRIHGQRCQVLKGIPDRAETVYVKQHNLRKQTLYQPPKALDRQGNEVSLGDVVQVVNGAYKKRQGPVQDIYQGILFILDRKHLQNGGFLCVHGRSCETVRGIQNVGRTNANSFRFTRAYPQRSLPQGPQQEFLSVGPAKYTPCLWKTHPRIFQRGLLPAPTNHLQTSWPLWPQWTLPQPVRRDNKLRKPQSLLDHDNGCAYENSYGNNYTEDPSLRAWKTAVAPDCQPGTSWDNLADQPAACATATANVDNSKVEFRTQISGKPASSDLPGTPEVHLPLNPVASTFLPSIMGHDVGFMVSDSERVSGIRGDLVNLPSEPESGTLY